MTSFEERLNRILPILTSERFLRNHGLGNEVPFYAFDYPPEAEEQLRRHVEFVTEQLAKQMPPVRFAHVNLFAELVDILEQRGFYDKAITVQQGKGDEALIKALQGPLKPAKVAEHLVAKWPPDEHDVFLLTGVGSAYPIMRTHNLLNNLQPLLGATPLVLFFPGKYDGQSLRLFGSLQDNPYYRAFRLVD